MSADKSLEGKRTRRTSGDSDLVEPPPKIHMTAAAARDDVTLHFAVQSLRPVNLADLTFITRGGIVRHLPLFARPVPLRCTPLSIARVTRTPSEDTLLSLSSASSGGTQNPALPAPWPWLG